MLTESGVFSTGEAQVVAFFAQKIGFVCKEVQFQTAFQTLSTAGVVEEKGVNSLIKQVLSVVATSAIIA